MRQRLVPRLGLGDAGQGRRHPLLGVRPHRVAHPGEDGEGQVGADGGVGLADGKEGAGPGQLARPVVVDDRAELRGVRLAHRHGCDLGYEMVYVAEATLTFPMRHASGRVLSPAEIRERGAGPARSWRGSAT